MVVGTFPTSVLVGNLTYVGVVAAVGRVRVWGQLVGAGRGGLRACVGVRCGLFWRHRARTPPMPALCFVSMYLLYVQ